ncbi:MAG: sugar phosphate isomerase/epimerase [Phycisphaerales bacterium]|nr:sugar phosphate isomerase/epimerase [Phycisphaerales bacterium]
MKLGVMGAGLGAMGWEKALDYCKHIGLDAIELPVGAYPGTPFFDPRAVLESSAEQQRIRDDVARRGLEIIGLATHGNPVSPDRARAKADEESHDIAVRLAPKLGTNVVINFSGCPGGSPSDKMPNWVTCPWPEEYGEILRYQWDDVLIPFWSKKNKQAESEGVRIAFEAHPGFCVYNPETILRLRDACGKQLGANLDPSHFFWQGIDPVESARVLGEAGCIFHVHGKDTGIDPHNTRLNGTLDTKSYGDLRGRSWVFRTCGYGHGDEFWKPFISMLRRYDYDGVISIEHEDSLMSVQEGFEKAVRYLRGVMIEQPAGEAWWFGPTASKQGR